MSERLHSGVPGVRVRVLVDRPPRADASYVLYWMIASRRTRYSFALQRAHEWARHLGLPLLVLEPLRAGYRWAADRHHAFVIQGMHDQQRRFDARRIRYLPYVEPEPGHGQGLLAALAERAALVVTDDYPAFFLPRMLNGAKERVGCRLEAIDGNGLLPIHAPDREFTRAHSFRAHLQKELPAHLDALPRPDPTSGYDQGWAVVPREVLDRWPPLTSAALRDPAALVASLPIDHEVGIVAQSGGEQAGGRRLARFLDDGLLRYGEQRNHPDEDAGSGLSPWLHFGHVGAHQVLHALAAREGWSPVDLGPPQGGSKEGWWGVSASAEAFLDELVTWRELGFNLCTQRADYDRFESLPAWARKTMAEHARDPRPERYDLDRLDAARTDDPLWNAAQRQLRTEGRIHSYLRMLWGKRIYEWSDSGEQALERLVHLNNRWSVDGRDPNSYSGITWVLGRFDRAWGPERPIFGKLRYMTSDSARRKLRLRQYLARYGEAGDEQARLRP